MRRSVDFKNMRLVGELLRSCGAFFIRRSFAADDLYWTVFSHYIKALVRLSQEPLEFFIEGTRSRTNKSLHPKIGLLGIVLELWLSGSTDVCFVPISISYDRVLEESLYAWELFGVPKPKESTSVCCIFIGYGCCGGDCCAMRHSTNGEPITISTTIHDGFW